MCGSFLEVGVGGDLLDRGVKAPARGMFVLCLHVMCVVYESSCGSVEAGMVTLITSGRLAGEA